MKCCLISPVPDLQRYVDEHATHHLTLAHVMDEPGYIEFYWNRSELGDYVIVDNGAKEMGAGLSMSHVLAAAVAVQAKEVVLTDVRYKCPETIASGKAALEWLQSPSGQAHYEMAGHPKLMLVPQGENPEAWLMCLTTLLALVDIARDKLVEMPPPTIGFAYHYDHLFEGGLYKLLESFKRRDLDIHLLGWPRSLEVLIALADDFGFIRSVDSGRPFSYAKAGKRCRPGQENPGRDVSFFTEPIPDEELVWRNINTFRNYAKDTR